MSVVFLSAKSSFSLYYLHADFEPEYPGIVFHKKSVSVNITSSGATIDQLQDMGVSISVPEDSVETPLDLHIRPCFHVPSRLPENCRSASPAYLITHGGRGFQKGITIRIHHQACLTSEEDSARMSFVSASSTPEQRGSEQGPYSIYSFEKISGNTSKFTQEDQVGEITLRHFCLIMVVHEVRYVTSGNEECDGKLIS
jgi:hypothetical protein